MKGRTSLNDFVLLLNVDIFEDFPISIIPITEQALFFKDEFLAKHLLTMLKSVAISMKDGELLTKYLEYSLPILPQKTKLKLIRWAIKKLKDIEITPLNLAKLYLMISKTFLNQNMIYKAQHYAFLTLHVLNVVDIPEKANEISSLKLRSYVILANVFSRRGFIRYSRRFLLKALSLLEEELKPDVNPFFEVPANQFLKVALIALNRVNKLILLRREEGLNEKGIRAELELLIRILDTIREMNDIRPLWKYISPDTGSQLVRELRGTVKQIKGIKLPLKEKLSASLDSSLKLLKDSTELSRYRLKGYRDFLRDNLYKVKYLEEAGLKGESFKLLKKLFVISKYQMLNWRYLLIIKYNMFKILYNADLERKLSRYLIEKDVERYIKVEEASYLRKMEIWYIKGNIYSEGYLLTDVFKLLTKRLIKSIKDIPFDTEDLKDLLRFKREVPELLRNLKANLKKGKGREKVKTVLVFLT